jgi:DnaK suppressor protein
MSKDIVHIKAELLKAKYDLETKLSQMAKEQFSDGQVQDPGDQALASTMEALQSSLQETELEQYKRVARALEKIEEGSYGICIDCGNDISQKRLASFPDSARCLLCEESRENAAIFF